jgi:hypothetical protein
MLPVPPVQVLLFMTPRDENVLKVLNILTTLFHSRKQKIPKLSKEEQHILIVTEEHIAKENITIFTFLNTLRVLNEMGYLMATGIFENEYHEKIRDAFKDENYNFAQAELSKINNGKLTTEQKEVLANEIKRMLPPGEIFDQEAFDREDITYKELFDPAKLLLENHKDDEVAIVTLMPFRDIDRLFEKMNAGQGLDEIQDTSNWYDGHNCVFHLGTKTVSAMYHGKANVEHDILKRIKECLHDGVVWYEDVSEHKPTSLRRRLIDFVNKDEELKNIFTVYSDRLEFDKEAFY